MGRQEKSWEISWRSGENAGKKRWLLFQTAKREQTLTL